MPVANAIKARQIGAGLGCRHQVIHRNRVLRMLEADALDDRPSVFERRNSILNRRAHLRVQPSRKVLLGNPDLQPLHVLRRFNRVIRYRKPRTGRIIRVMPRQYPQHLRRISHITGKRPHAVQRRSKRNQPIPRNPPIRRQHTHHSAKARRLANRPARIRAQRRHGQIRRNSRRRPSTRTTRHPLRVIRIPHRTIRRVLILRTHRKLVAIDLAK